MNKKYYLALIILVGFLSTNLLAKDGDRKKYIPIHSSEISAESFFVKSKILKVPIVREDLNVGDNYSYQKILNSNTYDLFRIRMAGLFHQYQERTAKLGWAPGEQLQLTEEDNVNLGIDIDFGVGKVLSLDTFITSINQYDDSPVIDGKIIENYHLIDIYTIEYKLKSSGRQLEIHSGHTLTGRFETDEYYAGFQSGANVKVNDTKINDVKMTVIEKASIKPRTGKRPGDTIRPERY